MSQPPSQSDPRHNRLRSNRPPRILRAPHERFADLEEPASEEPTSSSKPEREEIYDPFQLPSYSEEELEWRRLSPQERRKQNKLQKKNVRHRGRNAPHGKDHAADNHQRRATAAREFSQHVREDLAPPLPRKKKKSNGRAWLVLMGAASFGLLVYGVGFALTSPKFKIDSVDVVGQTVTPLSKLTPLAQHLVGQNLLLAKTGTVETELEKLPTVSEAHVSRLLAWPPRASVRIVERQAAAMVGAGQNFLVVDAQGIPFRAADLQGEDAHLFAVTNKDWKVKLGKALPPKVWGRVSELLATIQQDNQDAAWAWQPRRIFFENDSASMWVPAKPDEPHGPEILIRLGSDRWEEKLQRSRVTLGYFNRTGRDAATLDIVSYDRPVWKPRVHPKTDDQATEAPEPVAVSPVPDQPSSALESRNATPQIANNSGTPSPNG